MGRIRSSRRLSAISLWVGYVSMRYVRATAARQCLLALLVLLGLVSANAQFRSVKDPPRPAKRGGSVPVTSEGSDTYVFRSEVRLITLLATVKDETGNLVGNLEKDEFQLTDNGAPQKIALFEQHTEQPLSVSILIDVSLTTAIRLKQERESVERFLNALIASGNPEDTAALYAFDDEVTLLQGFTRDIRRLRRALAKVLPGGGTSIYDALYLTADAFGDRQGRHVVVLVSDGSDTTSRVNISTAIKSLHQADTIVYPVVVVPVEAHAGRSIGGENALQIIAQRTGGRVYAAKLGADLDRAFTDLLRDLRTQYLIGFYPQDAPPSKDGFHQLVLETTRPGLLVQTRSGYYGVAGSPDP